MMLNITILIYKQINITILMYKQVSVVSNITILILLVVVWGYLFSKIIKCLEQQN